jgi:hypothetical protein
LKLRFLWIFQFLPVLGFIRQKKNQMPISNSARAGLNAFKVSPIALALAIAILSAFETPEAAMITFALVFTVQLLTFIISLNCYEKRGQRELNLNRQKSPGQKLSGGMIN